MAFDMDTINQYAHVIATDEADLAAFVRGSLVRPQFLPVVDRWGADVRAGRLPSP